MVQYIEFIDKRRLFECIHSLQQITELTIDTHLNNYSHIEIPSMVIPKPDLVVQIFNFGCNSQVVIVFQSSQTFSITLCKVDYFMIFHFFLKTV